MSSTPLTFDYFLELYGWLLHVRGELPYSEPFADVMLYAQTETARSAFQVLVRKGFSCEQVKASVENIHASGEYSPKRSLALCIAQSIQGMRQPTTFSVDPGVVEEGLASLPPSFEKSENSANLLASANQKNIECPNPLLSEAASTYWDWSVVGHGSMSVPPSRIPIDGTPSIFHSRICFFARRAFKSSLGNDWHLRIKSAFSGDEMYSLFGDRRVFD